MHCQAPAPKLYNTLINKHGGIRMAYNPSGEAGDGAVGVMMTRATHPQANIMRTQNCTMPTSVRNGTLQTLKTLEIKVPILFSDPSLALSGSSGGDAAFSLFPALLFFLASPSPTTGEIQVHFRILLTYTRARTSMGQGGGGEIQARS